MNGILYKYEGHPIHIQRNSYANAKGILCKYEGKVIVYKSGAKRGQIGEDLCGQNTKETLYKIAIGFWQIRYRTADVHRGGARWGGVCMYIPPAASVTMTYIHTSAPPTSYPART